MGNVEAALISALIICIGLPCGGMPLICSPPPLCEVRRADECHFCVYMWSAVIRQSWSHGKEPRLHMTSQNKKGSRPLSFCLYSEREVVKVVKTHSRSVLWRYNVLCGVFSFFEDYFSKWLFSYCLCVHVIPICSPTPIYGEKREELRFPLMLMSAGQQREVTWLQSGAAKGGI